MLGKTETGKLYHIINNMTGGGHFALCGCYLPDNLHEEGLSAFELDKQGLMCEKCMNSCYYSQSRD